MPQAGAANDQRKPTISADESRRRAALLRTVLCHANEKQVSSHANELGLIINPNPNCSPASPSRGQVSSLYTLTHLPTHPPTQVSSLYLG